MDPAMHGDTAPRHHLWAHRLVWLVVLTALACAVCKVGFAHWAINEAHAALQATGLETKKPEPVASFATDGWGTGPSTPVRRAESSISIVAEGQSCVRLDWGQLTRGEDGAVDGVRVQVTNTCGGAKTYTKLTMKAYNVSNVVVASNYEYINTGDVLRRGERRVFEEKFGYSADALPADAVVIGLEVEPGNTQGE